MDPYSTMAPGGAQGVNVVTRDFTWRETGMRVRAASGVSFSPNLAGGPSALRTLDLRYRCEGGAIDEVGWRALLVVLRSPTMWAGSETLGTWPTTSPAEDHALFERNR